MSTINCEYDESISDVLFNQIKNETILTRNTQRIIPPHNSSLPIRSCKDNFYFYDVNELIA